MGDLFGAGESERGEGVIDERWVVGRLHGERVAGEILQAAASEVQFVVPGVLRCFWSGKVVGPGQVGNEGIFDVLDWLGWGGFAHKVGKGMGVKIDRESMG